MKMILISASSLYFLAFDRISVIPMPGVSSMMRFDAAMTPEASTSFDQSLSDSLPVRIFCASTRDSSEKSLFMSCPLDISSEKSAQGRFFRKAIYSQILSASAVFPMDGRAAIRMKSEFCSPEVL